MWEKWAFLCTLAACTCLFDGSIGEILSSTDYGQNYIEGVYKECNEIMTKSLLSLDLTTTTTTSSSDDLEKARKSAVFQRVLANPNSTIRASMSRDMQNGYETEGDHIIGDMIFQGKQHGISTPLLQIAYTRLQIYEKQRRVKLNNKQITRYLKND